MRKNCRFFTSQPFLRRMPIAAMLADAPIGVILPPRVAPVRSPKNRTYGSTPIDAAIAATTGSIVANNVDATAGDATVTAANDVTTGTIGAGGTATAEATAGNATVTFDANNVNATAGGNADVTVAAGGAHNPSGDLNLDSNVAGPGVSSLNVGGNANLKVDGALTTSGNAALNVSGNLAMDAGSVPAPLNTNVGGSINANSAGQAAIALNMNGAHPVVEGNRTHTAIFIDGRLAGGDPRYFSILQGYEAEIGDGVKSAPLPSPAVANVFTAPFYTMDLPFGAPGSLGQSYQSDEAGKIDAGDEFPEADTSLSIPGLPKNSTIFFGTSKEGEKKDQTPVAMR